MQCVDGLQSRLGTLSEMKERVSMNNRWAAIKGNESQVWEAAFKFKAPHVPRHKRDLKKDREVQTNTNKKVEGRDLNSWYPPMTDHRNHLRRNKLVRQSPYHLVGGVVCLELFVGRVLHVNGVVSDDGGGRGVVAHH